MSVVRKYMYLKRGKPPIFMTQISQMLNERRIFHLSRNNLSVTLNVCASPHLAINSYVENLMPNVVLLMGGVFGSWLEISVLIKEAQESSSCLLCHEVAVRRWHNLHKEGC